MKSKFLLLVGSIGLVVFTLLWLGGGPNAPGAQGDPHEQRVAKTVWASEKLRGFRAFDVGVFSSGRIVVAGHKENQEGKREPRWFILTRDGITRSTHTSDSYLQGSVVRSIARPDGLECWLLSLAGSDSRTDVSAIRVGDSGAVVREFGIVNLPKLDAMEATCLGNGDLVLAVTVASRTSAGSDIFAFCVDEDGKERWRRQISGSGLDGWYGSVPLSVTRMGSRACVISFTSDSIEFGAEKGKVGVVSLCIDEDGATVWRDLFAVESGKGIGWRSNTVVTTENSSQFLIGVTELGLEEIGVVVRGETKERSATSTDREISRRVEMKSLSLAGRSGERNYLGSYPSSPLEFVASNRSENLLVFLESRSVPEMSYVARIVKLRGGSVGKWEYVVKLGQRVMVSAVPLGADRLAMALWSPEPRFSEVWVVRCQP